MMRLSPQRRLSRWIHVGTPARLASLFVLVTLIPLAVLGWLGRWSLQQERALEAQRRLDGLHQSAALLVRELDGVLQRWHATAAQDPAALVDSIGETATVLVIGADGTITTHGAPLLFYPVRITEHQDDERLAAAERMELVDGDLAIAAAEYRRAALTTDRSTKAAALVGLGRCLSRQGRSREALETYTQLASLDDAAVAGFPAELIARHERAAILSALKRSVDADAERARLRDRLLKSTYRIDRATFDILANDVPDLDVEADARSAADTVFVAAKVWQQQPVGITFAGQGEHTAVAIWRPGPVAGTIAIVTPLRAMLSGAQRSASGLGVALALIGPDGQRLWGDVSQHAMFADASLRDFGSAATALRVSSALTSAATTSVARERIYLAGFALLASVIVASGYVVFRSMRRELGVAQLQSEFVSTVSHEFRSPLTAMRHLTETLEDGGASVDRLPDYYRALGKETRRLQSTVETVLDFGRLDSEHRTYDFTWFDAVELVRGVINDLSGSDSRAPRRIDLDAPAHADVRADRDALLLAVRNLIENAINYSEPPCCLCMSPSRSITRRFPSR